MENDGLDVSNLMFVWSDVSYLIVTKTLLICNVYVSAYTVVFQKRPH